MRHVHTPNDPVVSVEVDAFAGEDADIGVVLQADLAEDRKHLLLRDEARAPSFQPVNRALVDGHVEARSMQKYSGEQPSNRAADNDDALGFHDRSLGFRRLAEPIGLNGVAPFRGSAFPVRARTERAQSRSCPRRDAVRLAAHRW